MKLSKQNQPIFRTASGIDGLPKRGLAPSQGCAGVPTSIIGACFGNSGPITGKFNCAACCALRGAMSWQGGGHAVAC
jgi:hypothetical protein